MTITAPRLRGRRRSATLERILAASPSARRARRTLLHMRAGAEARWDGLLQWLRPEVVALESVRRRLELLITAFYGAPIAIEAMDAAPHGGWIRRYVLGRHGTRDVSEALPGTDGERVLLPRSLDATAGDSACVALYRLLAFEQAERVVRGTAASLPGPGEHPLIRELYLISEAAAIDRRIAREIGGMGYIIDAARREALRRRPRFPYPTRSRRAVEALVRAVLRAGRESQPEGLPLAGTPADSLAWATRRASEIGLARRYEPVEPVWHWGRVAPPPVLDPDFAMPETDEILRSLVPRTPPLPFTGIEAYGGDGRGDGARLTPQRAGDSAIDGNDDRTEGGAPENGHGAPRRDAARTARDRTTLDDLREPSSRRDDPAATLAAARTRALPAAAAGERYHEWDYVTARYRERAVTVHGGRVADGPTEWATAQMRAHASAIREIRQRFERLRARRLRLRRQLDGEELDMEACVRSLVAIRMGLSGDERLYAATRATRQPLAIELLVDVSGSTGAPVSDGMRMIDIERSALLLASEALSALGDRYSILTFTGNGAHDVRVHTVKGFSETNGEFVRRRIAGLHPGGFTRLGAALRHATAELTRERVRHRLLLVLSDGRPNDLGYYASDYGVEDSRQAINEARAQGIHPFCLNVDPDGPEYLARIFGPAGYVTLRRPEQLPHALLRAVRTLID